MGVAIAQKNVVILEFLMSQLDLRDLGSIPGLFEVNAFPNLALGISESETSKSCDIPENSLTISTNSFSCGGQSSDLAIKCNSRSAVGPN
jgi:hypothetical protein